MVINFSFISLGTLNGVLWNPKISRNPSEKHCYDVINKLTELWFLVYQAENEELKHPQPNDGEE